MVHRASPLNMWRMKVKTGLQSNPSRLFVSFGYWENSDVVLPCWRGRQRGVGGGMGMGTETETEEKETFLSAVQ